MQVNLVLFFFKRERLVIALQNKQTNKTKNNPPNKANP